MLLVLAFLVFCIHAQSVPGTLITFDSTPIISAMNTERKSWGIPILEYDEDLAKIAAYYCVLCDWPNIPTSSDRGPLLGRLKGFIFNDQKYQSTGEARAASAGAGADPSPNQWLSARNNWNCQADSCNASTGCDAYRQVIWKDTAYVGCAKCRCNTTAASDPFPNDNSPLWDFLICDFNIAGNWAGEHPFGADQAKVCAGTWTPPPFSPQPVCQTCSNGCPAPVAGATCDSTTGAWKIDGPVSISQITTDVNCAFVINGDLTGTDQDRLNVSWCGGVTVTGAVQFSSNPGLELDYDGVSGIGPGSWKPFLNYTSITGTFRPPVAREVYSPLVELCAITVVGQTGSLVYLYDCLDATAPQNIPTNLPDGAGTKVNQTASGVKSYSPANPALGGDINDPDTNTEPKGELPPPGEPLTPPGSSNGLPGWAIFLIVLAVLIVVAVIIALIFFLFTSGDNTERF